MEKEKLAIPRINSFIKGCNEFERHEKREAMYKVATFLINNSWGKPYDMANGLGVLLLTWNQAFYRYGFFDFDKLETCIENNLKKLTDFRRRNILDYSVNDNSNIKGLFKDVLQATQIANGTMKGIKSPVAVAKALHLLAPEFFPIWDDRISKAYHCYYSADPAGKYINFIEITKEIADKLKDNISRSDKTLIKLIDQYNYSKYTKEWV